MLVVPAAVIAIAVYLSGGRYVSTENAYVKSDIVQIGTNLDGLITRVHVAENQVVAKGDRLFSIDARLFEKQLAVASADVLPRLPRCSILSPCVRVTRKGIRDHSRRGTGALPESGTGTPT